VRRWRRLLGLCAVALLMAGSRAGAQEAVPKLDQHVVDMAGVLGARKAAITDKVLAFQAATGNQVFVLTVPTTAGRSIKEFAVEVFKRSKIGQHKRDNGVLFVIATDDHKMRIEVGYGLEGVLTDAVSARILNDIVAPQMKGGLVAAGIEDGVDAILYDIDPVRGKAAIRPPPPLQNAQGQFGLGDSFALAVLFVVFWIASLWLGVLPFAFVVTVCATVAREGIPGVFVGAFGWWTLAAVVATWGFLRWKVIAKSVRKYRLQDSTCQWCTWLWAFMFMLLNGRPANARENGWSGDLSFGGSSSNDGGGGASQSDGGGGGGESGGGGASASW
jgi:uncharacterized protein